MAAGIFSELVCQESGLSPEAAPVMPQGKEVNVQELNPSGKMCSVWVRRMRRTGLSPDTDLGRSAGRERDRPAYMPVAVCAEHAADMADVIRAQSFDDVVTGACAAFEQP